MKCPRCHAANADGARFCGACGASLLLDAPCASCGHANPVGQKFCNGCGQRLRESAGAAEHDPRAYTPQHLAEKILGARSALEGERKQVTVLFADVKGSMELAEQLDPEEWHRLMDRFFQLLSEGIHRFEGTVNQYTGDGIMALFGAPIAHEDHAQRACWAALHLTDALRRYADELRLTRGLNFAVRMGINSGEVVVGTIGDDLRMDYTAQGHTVGLAQRMEQLAEPGSTLVTEHTAKLAAGFFSVRDLGAMRIKGLSTHMHVYELAGAGALRTRLDVARARGFSRFVGRADEMTTLGVALERAIAGEGHVVGVVAEPGTGKSRLCHEFVQTCRARGLAVHESYAVAHGKMLPFLPMLELLRAFFGVTAQDRPEEARRKIAGTLLLRDEAFRETVPLLFEFLGVSDPERPAPRLDPEARQRQLFAVVKRLVQGATPTVLLMEDLHWVDGGTELFLAAAVEALVGSRTLLLVSFRPEYHAEWMRRPHYCPLALPPLGEHAVDELLDELVGSDPALVSVRALVRERTRGNPFFVEEVVLSLFDQGALVRGSDGAIRVTKPIGDLHLPASVQAVIAARIDRLPEADKEVLQTAAVVGKEFSEPVLRRVLPDGRHLTALPSLIAADLVREVALYPEAEYAFKHPLTQEVAYHSQLTDRRARTHAVVAEAIAALHGDALDEQAALLSHHWERAGDLFAAARWSRRAAERAGFSDPTEAYRHWAKVRDLLGRMPQSTDTLDLALAARVQMLNAAWRTGVSETESDQLMAETRALADRTDDKRSLSYALGFHAVVKMNLGKLSEYLARSLEEACLTDEIGDRLLRGTFRIDVATASFMLGRFAEALAALDEAADLLGTDPTAGTEIYGMSSYLVLLNTRSLVLTPMGRLREAERAVTLGENIAQRHGQDEILCWLLLQRVEQSWFSGSCERALAHAHRAVEVAEQVGNAFTRAIARYALALGSLLQGSPTEAAEVLQGVLADTRKNRVWLCYEPGILSNLAAAYLDCGDIGRARAAADEAVGVARTQGALPLEILAQIMTARTLLRANSAASGDATAAALRRALDLVAETGARGYEPFVHAERAKLARLVGDEAAQRRELREAHRLFTEMGATARAEQVARELGSSTESTSGISSTSRT